MYSQVIFAVLASATTVLAQACVPELSSSLYASYAIETAGVSGATTTYDVNCRPGTTCAFGANTATAIVAPGTYDYFFSGAKMTFHEECTYVASTGTCIVTNVAAGQTELATASFSSVKCAAQATNTMGAGSGSNTSGAAATGPAVTGPAATATGSASAAATAGSSSSKNAAMPQVTGNARWAVGGALAMAMAVI